MSTWPGKIGLKDRQKAVLNAKTGLETRQKVILDAEARQKAARRLPKNESPAGNREART